MRKPRSPWRKLRRSAALASMAACVLSAPSHAQTPPFDPVEFSSLSGLKTPAGAPLDAPIGEPIDALGRSLTRRPLSIEPPAAFRAPSVTSARPAKRLKQKRNATAPTGPKPQQSVRLGVGVEETYTSNVRREPKAVSDLVTTVSPSISIRQNRERLDANVNAVFNYETHLRKSETNRLNVDLQGISQLKLIRDLAAIDLRGFVTRQQTNALAAAQGDRPISGAAGESTIQGYTIGPQLGGQVSDWAQWQLGYRMGQTFTTNPVSGLNAAPSTTGQFSNSQTNRINASVETGQNFSFYRGRLSASDSDTKRSGVNTGGDFGATNLELANQYLILPHLSALLVVGADSYRIQQANRDLSGPYAQAGFAVDAGSRAEFRFLVGRRYNDLSLSSEAKYRPFRQLSFGMLYSDTVSTQQNQFLDALAQATSDPDGNLVNVRTLQPFSANAPVGLDINNSVFREQRVTSNASVLGLRNTIVLTGFLANRTNLTETSAAAASSTQQSFGGGLQLNHSFSQTLTGQMGLNGSLSSATGPTQRPDSVSMQVGASLTEKLSPSSTLKLRLGYLDQYYLSPDAQQSAAATSASGLRPIKEMIATVGLRKEF